MSPVLQEACANAWKDLMQNPAQSEAHAAVRHGVATNTFKSWIRTRHPCELKAKRQKLGLPLTFLPGSLICGLCGRPMAYPETPRTGQPLKAVHSHSGKRKCG